VNELRVAPFVSIALLVFATACAARTRSTTPAPGEDALAMSLAEFARDIGAGTNAVGISGTPGVSIRVDLALARLMKIPIATGDIPPCTRGVELPSTSAGRGHHVRVHFTGNASSGTLGIFYQCTLDGTPFTHGTMRKLERDSTGKWQRVGSVVSIVT
jgi:hypothetical protein